MSFIARVVVRIYARRSLYLDDYIVLIGVMCLCAATGLVYKGLDKYFRGHALANDPSLFTLSPNQIDELLKPYLFVYTALVWTAIFAVKFSFLAFFKKLTERMTNIHTYYWIVVVIIVISWLFIMVEPFIICPQFGSNTRSIISLPSILERR